MTLSTPVAPRVMAALVGIAVPCLVFGRAVTAVVLILAVLGVFFLPHRQRPGGGSPPPAQGAT